MCVWQYRNNLGERLSAGGFKKKKNVEKGDPSSQSGVRVYMRKRPLFSYESDRGEFDVVTVPVEDKNRSSSILIHNCKMHADMKRCLMKHTRYAPVLFLRKQYHPSFPPSFKWHFGMHSPILS